jgi:pimeloyl-ACP methyl ester carboxylesterase
MQTILRAKTASGTDAMGWLHRASGAPTTLYVIIHGHNTTGDRSRYLTIAKWLEHGTGAPHSAADTLRWNAVRKPVPDEHDTYLVPLASDEYAQVEALVMHARQGRNYTRVIAIGHSQGAMHALRLAAERRVDAAVSIMGVGDTGASLERKKAAIGLGSGGDRVTLPNGVTMVYDSSFFPDFASWDMRRIIGQVHVPVLFIGGERDDTIPLAEVETAFAHANEPKAMIIVEDGHRFDDETAARIAKDIQDWAQ